MIAILEMYRWYWRVKKKLFTPRVIGIVRNSAYALLLFSIAVRAALYKSSTQSPSESIGWFIAVFTGVTLLACAIEFFTRRSGYRPELRDVFEICQGILRLDKFRDDARNCISAETLQSFFDDFVDDILALACTATRHPDKARLILMLPEEDDEYLEVYHVHPKAPKGAVNLDLQLPLRYEVDEPGPEHGLGAAGFAFRALFSVYVPNTHSRRAYWVHSDNEGGITFSEIGPVWVPEMPETSKSMIAVPIYVAGRDDKSYPWGVVNFGSPRYDDFGSSDFYVAAAFASILAQAFEITATKSRGLGSEHDHASEDSVDVSDE